MPTCFAEAMACAVGLESFGVSSTCQSSSAALDSERALTDRREDMAIERAPVELAKVRSPAKSASSSQFSISGAMLAAPCFGVFCVVSRSAPLAWLTECVRREVSSTAERDAARIFEVWRG